MRGGQAGRGDIAGCGLSTRAWELDVLGVSRPQTDFTSPPGLVPEQGLVSHPGRDFVLSLIPDPMQSNALRVIVFPSL